MIETAVILAAGRGKRLMPMTDKVPKSLIEVGGTPMSRRIVDQLIACGLRKIIFIVGYLGDQICSYYKKNRPSNIEYIFIKQEKLDGTAGAIKLARKHVGGDDFLVVFGDSYFASDAIKSVIEHDSSNAFGVVSVKDPERYGVAVINDEGLVIDVEEKPCKPKSNLVIGGIYKFSKEIWLHIENLNLSPRGEYELPDAIRSMIAEGIPIKAIELSYMIDVGTIKEIEGLNDRISKGMI